VLDEKARMRLRRHFSPGHWNPYPDFLKMGGLIAFVVGIFYVQYLGSLVLLSIVLAGSGFLVSYWRRLYVASNKEFDHIAETDYAGVQALALQRFELKPEDLRHIDPCKFRSFAWNRAAWATSRGVGHAFVGARTGSDEKSRKSPHEYLVINFGEGSLFVYRCIWDLTSGTTIVEETHEFSYRDIVCVELSHVKETIRINLTTRLLLPLWEKNGITPVNGWLQVPTDESVSLRLAQGEAIELFSWKRSGGGVPSGEGKTSFLTAQRLQKLVRELKQPRAATPTATPAAAPKALPTIRHMRRTSS
jgi:hypothetical protein